MMYYEIYDTQTRNLLLDTETIEEALRVVRTTVREHGAAAVATWLLVGEDPTDAAGGHEIAAGEALARLAMEQPAAIVPRHD